MYINKNLKIINSDCMEILKNYSNDYFDLAIVDPPYNVIDKKKRLQVLKKTLLKIYQKLKNGT
jgi:DNA modification methylase